MARSRNLKPSFFTNEQLAGCTPLARLLFAGLWCIADRQGKLRDRPRRIKAELLPYEAGEDADAWLEELSRAGLIRRYEVDGTRYLKVLAFQKHQNPHPREPASEIPEPCNAAAGRVQALPGPASNPLPSNPLASHSSHGRLASIPSRVAERLGQKSVSPGNDDTADSVARVVGLVGEDVAAAAIAQIVRDHLGGSISTLDAVAGWLDRIPDHEWHRARTRSA